LQTVPLIGGKFQDTDELQAAWLGHSTVLLRVDRSVLLTDPVFDDEVAISMGLQNTRRYFACPVTRENLPPIDAVLISHDHFDHLEESTVRFFSGTGTRYIVPLGLGAHLAAWGMPEQQIIELDWGDSVRIGNVTVYCTPARHLSGRSPFHRNQSFWASWVMAGGSERVFYSGDTGPGEHFAEIGRDYGPFDLTLMQIGAYDENWPDIHLTPEQAVEAQGDLRGALLLPVHWGTFDLALHAWDEPIIRLQRVAKEAGITIVTPRPGEIIGLSNFSLNNGWWHNVESKSDVR
jgi:L-ascorbate metabolism protein UlaG (beta-lactamase superfamily)